MSKILSGSRICIVITGVMVLAVTLVLASPAQAITWGLPDEDNIYSNVGSIVVDLTDREPLQFCSGTLIAPTVFLTAGHCTDYLEELISIGRLTLETTTVSFDPEDVLQTRNLDRGGADRHPPPVWHKGRQ